MNGFDVRQAGPEDIRAVVGLGHALFREDAGRRDPLLNLQWPLEHGAGYFAGIVAGEGSVCFLAGAGGETVGYLVGRLREPDDLHVVRTAVLESMFVREEWRGRGVGTGLVRAFLGWARARGSHSATVTAYSANERAISFYRKAGFAPKSLTLQMGLG